MKEKAPLCVDGAGLKKNQQHEKDDTSMNYYPKTAYWRPLFTNAESVDKKTNTYFKILVPHLLRETKHSLLWLKKSICFSIPLFTTTSKNMKKFISEIFKHTGSGKPDAEEASHIEVCVNPNIQEK